MGIKPVLMPGDAMEIQSSGDAAQTALNCASNDVIFDAAGEI
jgi:hypothetical protein